MGRTAVGFEGTMILYFENSAINWVLGQPRGLVRDMGVAGQVTLSEYNVLEMAATSKTQLRHRLLRTANKLAGENRPLVQAGTFLRKLLRAWRDGKVQAGISVGPRHAAWQYLNHPNKVGARHQATALSELQRLQSQFQGMQSGGREHFQPFLNDARLRKKYSTPDTFVEQHIKDHDFSNGFLRNFFIDFGCREAIGRVPELLNDIREGRAFYLGQLYGIHEWAIGLRPPNAKKPLGSVDLLQLCYLPMVDYFVTADRRLRNVAEAVARACAPTRVLSPTALRRELALQ